MQPYLEALLQGLDWDDGRATDMGAELARGGEGQGEGEGEGGEAMQQTAYSVLAVDLMVDTAGRLQLLEINRFVWRSRLAPRPPLDRQARPAARLRLPADPPPHPVECRS